MSEKVLVVMALVTLVAVAVAIPVFTKPKRIEKRIASPPVATKQKKRFSGGAQRVTRSMAVNADPQPPPVRRSKRVEDQRKPRSITINSTTAGVYASPFMSGPVSRAVRNKSIEVRHNSGGGDCLFLCFKEAIAEFGVSVTVQELRGIVAESVSEDQFYVLKAIYDGAVEEKEYDVIKDYNFMRGVQNVEELRKAMMTTHYWGDEMALSAVEDASGICAVVITTDDKNRPIVAQRLGKTIKNDTNRFIVLLLENSHYQLAAYKGNIVMDKEEVGNAVKEILGPGEA